MGICCLSKERIELERNNAKENFNLALGNTLKQLRKDNNITQAEAATRVDVDRVTISAYESGRIVPSINKMAKLARLYGVPQETLISLADNPDKHEKMPLSENNVYPLAANELLSYYKKLSPQLQEAVFLLVKDLYREGNS